MKMIDHNHFICHLILGTFTEYPYNITKRETIVLYPWMKSLKKNFVYRCDNNSSRCIVRTPML